MEGKKLPLFSDIPIEREEQDEFKIHTSYANTLYKIIESAPTPFSIGLFGKWGTGKTSIINLLKNKIISGKKHLFVYLDVWKYSKEPLKKWLLFEFQEQITQFIPEFKGYKYEGRDLKSHFEYEETWEEEKKTRINKGIVKTVFLIGVIAALIGITLFILAKSALSAFKNALMPLSGLSLFISVLFIGFRVMVYRMFNITADSLFATEKTMRTAVPTFSTEKFEKIFKDMVQKALSYREKDSKIVIVFDNLDRCEEETAIDTLSVIKTFMETKGCIYIIPCDDRAIIQYLKNLYTNNMRFGKDYLKKFFQLTIRIPELPRFDQEAYIDKLLNDIDFPLPNQAKEVISLFYGSKAPRQIKKSLNDLQGYLEIVKNLNREGVLTLNELNIAFLIKIIILSIEWPEFVEYLTLHPYALEEITEKIRKGETTEELKKYDAELFNFLKATQDIPTPENIKPYLFLKNLPYEKDPTFLAEIKENFAMENSDYFLKMLSRLPDEKKKLMIEALSDIASEWLASGKTMHIKNSARVLLEIWTQYKPIEELKPITIKLLRESILKTPTSELSPHNPLNMEKVLLVVEEVGPDQVHIILENYLKAIEETKRDEDKIGIFRELVKRCRLLSQDELRELSTLLVGIYRKNERLFASFVDIIETYGEDLKEKIISEEIIVSLAEKIKITPEDVVRYDLIKRLGGLYNKQVLENLIKKITATVDPLRSRGIDRENEFALSILRELPTKPLKDIDLTRLKENIVSHLKGSIIGIGKVSKEPWLNPLLKFKDLMGKDTDTIIEEQFYNLFYRQTINGISKIMDKIWEEERYKVILYKRIREIIRTKLGDDPNALLSKKELIEKFGAPWNIKYLPELINKRFTEEVKMGIEILEKAKEEGIIDEKLYGEIYEKLSPEKKDQ